MNSSSLWSFVSVYFV